MISKKITLKIVKDMGDYDLKIAIGYILGWVFCGEYWRPPKNPTCHGSTRDIPNFPTDLNGMAKAEYFLNTLDSTKKDWWANYSKNLRIVMNVDRAVDAISASARFRAEAFLLTTQSRDYVGKKHSNSKSTDKLYVIQNMVAQASQDRKIKKLSILWKETLVDTGYPSGIVVPELVLELESESGSEETSSVL